MFSADQPSKTEIPQISSYKEAESGDAEVFKKHLGCRVPAVDQIRPEFLKALNVDPFGCVLRYLLDIGDCSCSLAGSSPHFKEAGPQGVFRLHGDELLSLPC